MAEDGDGRGGRYGAGARDRHGKGGERDDEVETDTVAKHKS